MYKATHRAEAFGERVASRSIRPFRKGHSDQGFEVLQPKSMADQRGAFARQLRDVENALADLDAAVRLTQHSDTDLITERQRLRAVRANIIRQKGHLEATAKRAARLRFEELFVNVANARLHKDVFLSIANEARILWRVEGWGEAQGDGTWREQKKRMKKLAKASAIEARRADTPKSESVADESAASEAGDAQP